MRFLTAFLLGVVGLVGMSSNVVRADNIGTIPGTYVYNPFPAGSSPSDGYIADGVWTTKALSIQCAVQSTTTPTVLSVLCPGQTSPMTLDVDVCHSRTFKVTPGGPAYWTLSCDLPQQPLATNWHVPMLKSPCGTCTADYHNLTCTKCGSTGATLSLNTANCFSKISTIEINPVTQEPILKCYKKYELWTGNYMSQCQSCTSNSRADIVTGQTYPQAGNLKCTCNGVSSVLSYSSCTTLQANVDPITNNLVCVPPPSTPCPSCPVCPTITPCPTQPTCSPKPTCPVCPTCVCPKK